MNKYSKRKETNEIIHIKDALKNDGFTYICNVCKTEMRIRKGNVNEHHFAHIPNENNINCQGMSDWHSEWQLMFEQEEREVAIGEHRADILHDGYIIEFQHSPMSSEEMQKRIDFYTKEHNLIFVFDLRDKDITHIKDFRFKWSKYSRSIISPDKNDLLGKYCLFFQINNDELLWINHSTKYSNWSEFEIYNIVKKEDFKNTIKNLMQIGYKTVNYNYSNIQNKLISTERENDKLKAEIMFLERQKSEYYIEKEFAKKYSEDVRKDMIKVEKCYELSKKAINMYQNETRRLRNMVKKEIKNDSALDFVKVNHKVLDGKTINTIIKEVTCANILEVEVGTNGYHGGDSGSGSRTYFRIEDVSSTDINIKTIKGNLNENIGVEIELGGDSELATIIQALTFIIETLQNKIINFKTLEFDAPF